MTNKKFFANLPAPKVAALPNIPGGEDNLLPVAALSEDVKVTFDQWQNSAPTPTAPEKVRLIWDNVDVAGREWTSVIAPADLYVMLPKVSLSEGAHLLKYIVTLGNNNSQPSDQITVTIDKTAPVLAGTKDPLIFPPDLVGNRVTARYLEDHGNKLPATVPTYHQPKPGDTLFLYWETSPVGSLPASEKTLTQADMSLDVEFDGDLIVSSGDGQRYATYEVKDRAGNISVLSRAAQLDVDAQPIALTLPSVERSVPSGGGAGTLDPLLVTAGAVVVVPEEIEPQPTDVVTVYWKGVVPGASFQTETPIVPGGLRYAIPASAIPGNIGKDKVVEVYYTVTRAGGKVETSDPYRLTVLTIPDDRFPRLECKQATGTNPATLRLSAVPGGADFSILPWVFIKAGQKMHMWAVGVNKNTGGDLCFDVFVDRQVTTAEETVGVSALLPRSFLDQLKLDEMFSVDLEVSFDEGVSYLAFRQQNVLLVE